MKTHLVSDVGILLCDFLGAGFGGNIALIFIILALKLCVIFTISTLIDRVNAQYLLLRILLLDNF